MMRRAKIMAGVVILISSLSALRANATDTACDSVSVVTADSVTQLPLRASTQALSDSPDLTLWELPYSHTLSKPDWKHLWINTSILMAGGVTTLLVLKALPDDATAWNSHEHAKQSMFKRYVKNVKAGPVWDHDNPVFNFVLHPYAGAAYYMGARGAGFNCWGAFLYSFCISTFFWEYGFEAFNEIPSVQDLVITPVIGSLLGEGFYLIKRKIVSDGYRLCGSKVFGYIVAFLADPLNEVTGYFRGDQKKIARRIESRRRIHWVSAPWVAPVNGSMNCGISLTCYF